jgi:DNA polymerase III epsilon subunit-like protein
MSTIVYTKIETTGPDPALAKIIEIAAVAIDVESGEEIDSMNLLVGFDLNEIRKDQDWHVNYDPERWNGRWIDELDALADTDRFLKRHASVRRTLRKGGKEVRLCRVAGHGAAKFDYPFLLRWFRRHEKFWPSDPFCLDTAQLAAFMLPELAADAGYEALSIEALCGLMGVLPPKDRKGSSLAMSHARAAAQCADRFTHRVRRHE